MRYSVTKQRWSVRRAKAFVSKLDNPDFCAPDLSYLSYRTSSPVFTARSPLKSDRLYKPFARKPWLTVYRAHAGLNYSKVGFRDKKCIFSGNFGFLILRQVFGSMRDSGLRDSIQTTQFGLIPLYCKAWPIAGSRVLVENLGFLIFLGS